MNTRQASVTPDRAPEWSRFWATGALHSCPNAFAGNYTGEIRDHWTAFFGQLPAGSRVLDIGTGNGGIAFIARETAEAAGIPLEIEAIDAAHIVPAQAAAAKGIAATGINFRGGVSADATGYPDCWFDAVSGHYALEYTDVRATLAELARIMKPGGAALFVIHHVDSPTTSASQAELDGFQFLDHEAPLVVHARRFLARLATANSLKDLERLSKDAEAKNQVEEINRLAARVVQRARKQPRAGFIGAIATRAMEVLKQTSAVGPSVALERLGLLMDEMNAHRERLRGTVQGAHSAEDMARLTKSFEQAGFSVTPPTELKSGDTLIGWSLRARRI
jgi:ubiquinone/menaquinone biosynthesis C-methylase UbiE